MTEVRCDDFWRWYKPVSLRGRTIWMRTLSASDENERTKAAMQAARALRTAYLTEGSPERAELLGAYETVGKDELLAVIESYQTEMSRSMSFREVQPKRDPPEPKDVTLDAALEAQDEWEKEMVALAQRREKWAREQVETLMAQHRERDVDELRAIAIEMQISAFCTQAYMNEFESQTVYRACFNDKKFTKRTFRSVEDAGNVDHSIYQKLLEEYRLLDNYALEPEALKN